MSLGSPFHPLAVTATSALTAVGDSAEQTGTSIRAGISGHREHAYYRSKPRRPEREGGEPLIVADVQAVDPHLDGPARLSSLLIPVLRDLVRGLLRRHVERCALLVALPEAAPPVASWALGEAFLPALCRRLGVGFAAARVAQAGHAGMFELLREASALLAGGTVGSCIVAGVDSYLGGDRLSVLDEGYRLKSARNVDGFCPGEAASALLLEGPRQIRERGAAVRATIAALGTGMEARTIHGREASSGAGLTEALRRADAGAGGGSWVLCDLNGESYRAFEWGVVRARLGERFGTVERLVHPATSLGDVGAATGGVLVTAATEAFRRGYAKAEEATLWASSDGGLRAAVRLTRAAEGT